MSTIHNATARLIAGDWHGGQVSALYSLASTGRLTDADVPRAIHEVEQEIDTLTTCRQYTPDEITREGKRLTQLLTWLERDATVRGL